MHTSQLIQNSYIHIKMSLVLAHLTARELGINLKKLEIAVQGNINPARLLGQ